MNLLGRALSAMLRFDPLTLYPSLAQLTNELLLMRIQSQLSVVLLFRCSSCRRSSRPVYLLPPRSIVARALLPSQCSTRCCRFLLARSAEQQSAPSCACTQLRPQHCCCWQQCRRAKTRPPHGDRPESQTQRDAEITHHGDSSLHQFEER